MRDRFARAANRAARVITATLSLCCVSSEPPEDDFEPLPIEYVTEELEIATSFPAPLCGADLQTLNMHVRRIHDVLGTEGMRTLYIYDYDAWPIPGCRDEAFGCFDPKHRVAMGLPFALSHELVHAVSIDLGFPGHFWNEGLAEALSDHAIVYEPAELVSLLDAHPREYGYAIPGHFVRWLISWGGADRFVEFFVDGDFQSAYGMDLEDVELVYDAEAPDVLPSPFPCAGEPLNAAPDGSFDADIEFDCEGETTTRLAPGYETIFVGESRIIEITQPTTFSVVVDGRGAYDDVLISGCQTAAGEKVDWLGEVPNETASPAPTAYGELQVGVEQDVFLPAWTYRLHFVTLDEGATMRLRMSPK